MLLVAVSKTVDVERVRAADRGRGAGPGREPRAGGARRRSPRIGRPVPWHLIGHLQTNKVRDALGVLRPGAVGRSARARRGPVDPGRARTAAAPTSSSRSTSAARPQKGGVRPEDLRPALEAMAALPGLRLRGLMTIPPHPRDPEDSRPHYREMRKLLDAARTWGLAADFTELSMGMSGDFEVGVEEGATIVRVGTAIFGSRGG